MYPFVLACAYSVHKISSKINEITSDSNPLKPEVTIVIFIHYKPRIAVAILDL